MVYEAPVSDTERVRAPRLCLLPLATVSLTFNTPPQFTRFIGSVLTGSASALCSLVLSSDQAISLSTLCRNSRTLLPSTATISNHPSSETSNAPPRSKHALPYLTLHHVRNPGSTHADHGYVLLIFLTASPSLTATIQRTSPPLSLA
jgi:hypothetical protein